MPPQRTGLSISEPVDLTGEGDSAMRRSHQRRYRVRSGTTRTTSRPHITPACTVNRQTPVNAFSHLASVSASGLSSSQSPKVNSPSQESRGLPTAGGGSPKEKRLRRYRPSCPQAFHDIYERATTQRFYVLERYALGTSEYPQEIVELTGSTGNIYHVHIAKQLRCTCPHAEKGNQCKHMVYVLAKVLNAPFELVYQLALLSTELKQIFDHAPPITPPNASVTEDRSRKPIDGDCPICFSGLDAMGGESVVWCRAACGQNMHRDCFAMWAKSKAGETTCPFCRTVWEGNQDLLDVKKIDRERGQFVDGYVNIRDQLPGVSSARDERTYSRWSPYMSRRRSGYY